MTKHISSILLVVCICIFAQAQTPYDSFAPHISRPILDVEAVSSHKAASHISQDTIFYKSIIDPHQGLILLTDVSSGKIIAYVPITDDIHKWLSPDPLSDKYPEISPYAYCHWNPIGNIDPDGRDDFEVNWNSETKEVTINQIKNKNYDQFHVVDTDGNRIASSKQYDYRTITKLRNGTWGKSNLSLFDVNGDDNAEDLFKFLSSNFTTKKGSRIEWSRVMVGTSKSGRNIIGTSMKENATGIGHYIMHNGYTIRGVDHNHPHGTGPSAKDINNAKLYHKKFPSARLRVYTGVDYEVYDQGGMIYSIDEIIVIGNK